MSSLLVSLVFDVLKYAIGSMFLGVFFTALSVLLFFFLIKSLYPKYTYTPLSLIVGVVLFILISFQFIFICGAVKVKGMSDDIELSISQNIPTLWKTFGHEFTAEESQEIVERLADDFPLFGSYVGTADFRGHTTENIASSMVDEMNSFLNWFILRRVGWCLLFIALGTFIVIKTMETGKALRRKTVSAQRNRRHNDF